MWGPEGDFRCPLYHTPPYILRQGLSLGLGPPGCLVRGLLVSSSPGLGLQAFTTKPGFSVGSGDHTEALRHFIYEPSPHSAYLTFTDAPVSAQHYYIIAVFSTLLVLTEMSLPGKGFSKYKVGTL